jgi:hypothetical protein
MEKMLTELFFRTWIYVLSGFTFLGFSPKYSKLSFHENKIISHNHGKSSWTCIHVTCVDNDYTKLGFLEAQTSRLKYASDWNTSYTRNFWNTKHNQSVILSSL